MVRLNKIYTRTGDQGDTDLGGGPRRRKDDVRVVACGTVDELNVSIGVALCHANGTHAEELQQVQNDLFDLGADLCVPEDTADRATRLRITQEYIDHLERLIDAHNETLSPLKSFILPGGSVLASTLHVARTVARRAERKTLTLADSETINTLTLVYLNRLSDFLFVLARVTNDGGNADILWRPGRN
ncbi:MAG: cob(I)yrinic acid a,c-diamide adenosyltransferase [Alphaproteobacteria bacterium]|nr:cob(I)yrinic acid a,c-diamide adenosyltransferase [Alphaproteobacteria bacterium]